MTLPAIADARPLVSVGDLHDTALSAWRTARRPACTLVHLDAHLDCGELEGDGLHVGNFVRAGIREGLIGRVFWIVPDPVWRSKASRRTIARDLRLSADTRPAGWHATIEGAPVSVCGLADLPRLSDRVHLDIDIDYLFYADRRRDHDRPAALPWLWPRDLALRLAALAIECETITVASSVTGGFTPLRWKHLADDLRARLEGHPGDAYDAIERAATMTGQQQIGALREVTCRDEHIAAAWLHLAEALQAHGALDEARSAFARAVSLDPAYRHLYRSQGPIEQGLGRRHNARAEYEQALALDPQDPFSRIGLAQLCEDAGRTADARELFEAALAQPGGERIEAYRGLARTLERLDPERAIEAYERSLALAVGGQVPLSVAPRTNAARRIVDPQHFAVYGRIGELHARRGRPHDASINYRLAAAREPRYRVRVGWRRLLSGDLGGARDCVLGAICVCDRAVRRAVRRRGRTWYNSRLP